MPAAFDSRRTVRRGIAHPAQYALRLYCAGCGNRTIRLLMKIAPEGAIFISTCRLASRLLALERSQKHRSGRFDSTGSAQALPSHPSPCSLCSLGAGCGNRPDGHKFATLISAAGHGSRSLALGSALVTTLRRSIPDAMPAGALRIPHNMRFAYIVRDAGIEPASEPWEGPVLPLNESRNVATCCCGH